MKKKSTPSLFTTILTALLYAVMLLLILMFFTGNGQFIYEL